MQNMFLLGLTMVLLLAILRDFNVVQNTSVHNAGIMTSLREHCPALNFSNENYFKCCQKGKVALPVLSEYSPLS